MKLKNIYNFIRRIFCFGYKKIIYFIYPPLCAHCKKFIKTKTIFCSHCQSHIHSVVSTTLEITKTKKIKVFAASSYKDPLRSLILAKKYSDIVASRQLGHLIWDMTYIKNIDFDVIVPIALHWTRFSKRGFNQAHQMANIIAQKSGKPVVQLLKRIKKTKYQSQLQRNMRAENVKNAMKLVDKDLQKYKNKTILLVDDLLTTGATVTVAARELYKLNPAKIVLAVACRVV
ncbi:ComF family protein [bacterium]|nr:ComF family protein [bacterium]